MKKILWTLIPIVLLTGCTMGGNEMEEALAFRSRILGAEHISFEAEISADYIDRLEEFDLSCRTDAAGALAFRVTEPEAIVGITGTVTGEEGTLTFDDTVLAFPLLADDRLSPVSGPWVMMKALRSGCITAVVREGEKLHLTVDDSYGDDPLTLEIWIGEDGVDESEISYRGRRQMTMDIGDFRIG